LPLIWFDGAFRRRDFSRCRLHCFRQFIFIFRFALYFQRMIADAVFFDFDTPSMLMFDTRRLADLLSSTPSHSTPVSLPRHYLPIRHYASILMLIVIFCHTPDDAALAYLPPCRWFFAARYSTLRSGSGSSSACARRAQRPWRRAERRVSTRYRRWRYLKRERRAIVPLCRGPPPILTKTRHTLSRRHCLMSPFSPPDFRCFIAESLQPDFAAAAAASRPPATPPLRCQLHAVIAMIISPPPPGRHFSFSLSADDAAAATPFQRRFSC
jgi:hypothetical protein